MSPVLVCVVVKTWAHDHKLKPGIVIFLWCEKSRLPAHLAANGGTCMESSFWDTN